MVKDDPAAKVKAILPYIRKPLIYLATAMFMEETGAELGDKALFYDSIQPLTSGQNTLKREPSREQRIAAMVARNRHIGNSYLDILKSYLSENWDEYTGEVSSRVNRDNTGKKTFWT